jgi:hypothetical protein
MTKKELVLYVICKRNSYLQILGSFVYIAVSYTYTEQPWEEYRIFLFLMVCVTVTLTAQAAGFFFGVIAPLKVSSKKYYFQMLGLLLE